MKTADDPPTTFSFSYQVVDGEVEPPPFPFSKASLHETPSPLFPSAEDDLIPPPFVDQGGSSGFPFENRTLLLSSFT